MVPFSFIDLCFVYFRFWEILRERGAKSSLVLYLMLELHLVLANFVFQFKHMIKTGNITVSIYTEMTPNPETMKFVANKLLYPGKSVDFQDIDSAKPSPLALELFSFPFVKSVFIASNFVTLTKTSETDWDDVKPSIRQFLKDYLEDGKVIVNEDELPASKAADGNIV